MQLQETVIGQPKDVDLGYSGTASPYFNGSSDQIDIPYAPDLNPTSFTVEMWVQFQGGRGYRAILTSVSGSASLGRRGYVFCINPTQQWQFWLGSGQKGISWIILTGWKAKQGVWTHLAGTYDSSSETMILYVSGQAVGQWTGIQFQPNDRNPMHVGAGATEQAGASSCFFRGSITQVRIWERPLCSAEIQIIAAKGQSDRQTQGTITSPTSSSPKQLCLVESPRVRASLHLPVSPHPAILDWSSTRTSPPTGSNTSTQSKESFVEPVLVFDGKDDYVEVPYADSLNPSQFTLFCWVKVQGGQGTWRSAITSRDALLRKGYILCAGDNNRWQFWIGNGRNRKWSSLSGSEITLDTWTYLAATYNGSKIKFYINGELAGEREGNYVANSARPLRIGAAKTETHPMYLFPGQISEIRISDRVCTQEEIQTDAHYRLKGDEPGLVYYWALNEGSGNTAYDKAKNTNHGTIHGATWKQVEIPIYDSPPKAQHSSQRRGDFETR